MNMKYSRLLKSETWMSSILNSIKAGELNIPVARGVAPVLLMQANTALLYENNVREGSVNPRDFAYDLHTRQFSAHLESAGSDIMLVIEYPAVKDGVTPVTKAVCAYFTLSDLERFAQSLEDGSYYG